MIAVKVSYTVDPTFVEQNKRNVNTFLQDFKKLNQLSFLYNVYVQADRLTFLHISMYENDTVQQTVLETPSFLNFQKERDENGSHIFEIENLELIGSSLGTLTT